MNHVLVLGGTGMLGSAVTKKLTGLRKYRVTATCRPESITTLREVLPDDPLCRRVLFDPEEFVREEGEAWPFFHEQPFDFVVNCIGIIKPQVAKVGVESTIRVNSLFPHVLARFCAEHRIALIHITTDCVYSGKKGHYVETDEHDCDDIYGRTKSLGEPSDRAMVLRTSIIGPEIHNYSSLVAWVQSQKGKEVKGFIDHYWNGITTATYGSVVNTIIENRKWVPGLFHVFSPNSVSKYELVQMISRRYDLGVAITPFSAPTPVDRTLASVHSLCESLHVPDLEAQIREM